MDECVIDPTFGFGNGSGTGKTGGGPVAINPPTDGGTCPGSPPQTALGQNLPGGTNGPTTEITNISALQDASGNTYGWFYYTGPGGATAVFFQRNPAEAQAQINMLTGFLDQLPGISAIAGALVGATTQPYPLTPQQAQNITSNAASGGMNQHWCFQGGLSV